MIFLFDKQYLLVKEIKSGCCICHLFSNYWKPSTPDLGKPICHLLQSSLNFHFKPSHI